MPVDTLLEPGTLILDEMLQKYEHDICMSTCALPHLHKKDGTPCNGGKCGKDYAHTGDHICDTDGEPF
jgi:hypothetical protein